MIGLSVIIPVLNEEEHLRKQRQWLSYALSGTDTEVIVVDGGSHDASLEAAAELGTVITAEKGRARQMNAGARVASAPLLLFLHADTQLPAGTIPQIRATFADPGVVGGCFRKHYFASHPLLLLADFLTDLRFMLYFELYGDRAVFVRRAAFEAVGGYNDNMPLLEELDLGRRLRRIGGLRQAAARVHTSDRRFLQGGVVRTLWHMTCLELAWRLGLDWKALARSYGDHR